MPKSKITIACMDLHLKRALVEAIKKMAANDLDFDDSTYMTALKALPFCDGDEPIEFTEETKSKKGRKKSNRPPSAYQQHTGECMRGGGSMQECAAQWREKKAQGEA
jgi:hypothetical protein